jgi:ATP-dependent helicase HrpB
MLQDDSALAEAGCVIFDEFHERSLNADLGLALCLESQQNLREDLRLVVMSATLDLQPLARLLDGAPIVDGERAQLRGRDSLCAAPRGTSPRCADGAGGAFGSARACGRHSMFSCRVQPRFDACSARSRTASSRPALECCRCMGTVGRCPGCRSRSGRRRTAQGGAVDHHCGNQSDHRRHPCGRGLGIAPLCRIRSGDRNESPGHREGVAGGGRSAPRPRRPLERRVTATACGPRARRPRWRRKRRRKFCTRTSHPWPLEMSCWGAVDASSLRWLDPPPVAPLAQARNLLQQLEAIDSANRITAHGRELATVGAHPRLAHLLIKSRNMGAVRLACDLAAILSERDILRAAPGARDVDLRLRVAVLRGDRAALPSGITADARALTQAKRSSADWQRRFARGLDETVDPHRSTGILLALAYPDRIARARGDSGRYLLANGRGAHFAEPQALAKAEFIVAAELDGAEREARIFLAAPVSVEDLEREFSAHHRRSHGNRLGPTRAGGARAQRAPSRRPRAGERRDPRCGSRRRADSRPRRSAPNGRGHAALDPGAAPMAGARHVDAAIRGARSRGLAGLERRHARGDSRGMGAALDFRPSAPRAFCGWI